MKLQRRFAPISGEFAPESVARFIGIRKLGKTKLKQAKIDKIGLFWHVLNSSTSSSYERLTTNQIGGG